ncbi:hypothetical protein HYF16_003868 [Salmonella enterica]|nr:hypothetical protein [Salmonella enterica]EHF6857077.1 hypothetical protein [Salmonella enterica subsp. enterica serovar Panama]
MKEIKRLVIFGDSLSDIGNKRELPEGILARVLGLMRVNEAGRFSDGKNWTDFIWEWSGGRSMFQNNAETTRSMTKLLHLTFNGYKFNTTPFSYTNYSEGGAMGSSDNPKLGLGYFKEQKERFLKNVKEYNIDTAEPTLILVWFGLNDLVTNKRNKDDMIPVAQEIYSLCEDLKRELPGAYFIIANIPNPQTAVRYVGETKEKLENLNDGALQFSVALAERVNQRSYMHLVDIRTPTDDIDENMEKYGLIKGAQPHGEKVRYDGSDSTSRYSTTSDRAHPTEVVYRLIANIWASEIVRYMNTNGLTLGTLAQSGECNFIVQK